MQTLSSSELTLLVKSVFPKLPGDKKLAILTDVPNTPQQEKPEWLLRRTIAFEWRQALNDSLPQLDLEAVNLVAYPSVESNNADLPEFGYVITEPAPGVSSQLRDGKMQFAEIFAAHQLFLAPTQYSTTAPLKVNAKKYGFRAATMPGFSPAMIPALRLDYGRVNERCQLLRQYLDPAAGADVRFLVDGEEEYNVYFDLRHRTSIASSGRFPDAGTAGNLPSGETYIAPYEGEKKEKSLTRGFLPVQFGFEVVIFVIEENRATRVIGEGPKSHEQAAWLRREPAYGNMAELGFGVLADLGVEPIDEMLLDEKLAFHIAFGRSDHFGGATGPEKFTSPQSVVHIDYIYSPKIQPRIRVVSIDLQLENNTTLRIMENDRYLIF